LSEDREVYELIASLPVDYSRVNVLADITFEASILLRSKFVKKIDLKYGDFAKLPEISGGKNILLVTEIDSKRFLVYIEKGTIVSSLVSDAVKGERYAGIKPLAMLITIARNQPVKFKVFEVAEMSEDKTLEAPQRTLRSIPEEVRETATQQTMQAVETESSTEKPAVVEFAKRFAEFRNKVVKAARDLAPLYNCQVLGIEVSVSKGYVNVFVRVKKRGFFGKCDEGKLKNSLEKDLELLALMHDIGLPVKTEVIQQ